MLSSPFKRASKPQHNLSVFVLKANNKFKKKVFAPTLLFSLCTSKVMEVTFFDIFSPTFRCLRNAYMAVTFICTTTLQPILSVQRLGHLPFFAVRSLEKLLTTVALISVLLSWNVGGKIKTLYYQTLNGCISKIVGSRNLKFFCGSFSAFLFLFTGKKQG